MSDAPHAGGQVPAGGTSRWFARRGVATVPAVRNRSGDLRLAAATLNRRGWLRHQPGDLRTTILESVRIRRIDRGEAVFRHGERPDGLFGLVSGRVKFRTCTRGGREIVQGVARAGDWFGEVGVFDGKPRGQDAVALCSVVVATLSIDRFRAVTEANPHYLRNFAEIMARNIRAMSLFTFEVASAPPPERILRLLAFLLQEEIGQAEDDAIVLDVGQELLGAIAGLSRQTVNRELSRLAAVGLLECRYGRVVVHAGMLRRSIDRADPPALTSGVAAEARSPGRVEPAHAARP